MIDSIAGLTGLTASVPKNDAARTREAAGQFEALLISQLLKAAREAGGTGWLGTGDDEAGEIGSEMAEQELARALAASGGFGMARLIERGLESAADRPTGKGPAGPPPTPADTPTGSGE